MKKLILLTVAVVIIQMAIGSYAQTPTVASVCKKWGQEKIVPIKYVCGTELVYIKDKDGKVIGSVTKDVLCTRNEKIKECLEWEDVETSTGTVKGK